MNIQLLDKDNFYIRNTGNPTEPIMIRLVGSDTVAIRTPNVLLICDKEELLNTLKNL